MNGLTRVQEWRRFVRLFHRLRPDGNEYKYALHPSDAHFYDRTFRLDCATPDNVIRRTNFVEHNTKLEN